MTNPLAKQPAKEVENDAVDEGPDDRAGGNARLDESGSLPRATRAPAAAEGSAGRAGSAGSRLGRGRPPAKPSRSLPARKGGRAAAAGRLDSRRGLAGRQQRRLPRRAADRQGLRRGQHQLPAQPARGLPRPDRGLQGGDPLVSADCAESGASAGGLRGQMCQINPQSPNRNSFFSCPTPAFGHRRTGRAGQGRRRIFLAANHLGPTRRLDECRNRRKKAPLARGGLCQLAGQILAECPKRPTQSGTLRQSARNSWSTDHFRATLFGGSSFLPDDFWRNVLFPAPFPRQCPT